VDKLENSLNQVEEYVWKWYPVLKDRIMGTNKQSVYLSHEGI